MSGTRNSAYTMVSPSGRHMNKESDFWVEGVRFKFMGWNFEFGPAACWESIDHPVVIGFWDLQTTPSRPHSYYYGYKDSGLSGLANDHSVAMSEIKRLIEDSLQRK